MKALLSPDAPEGGDNSPAPAPAATPPPAASLVMGSDAREGDAAEMVRLKRELDEEKRVRKAREVRVSELEDNVRTLTTPPVPAPAPAAPAKKGDKWTFFDGDDE